MPETPSRPRSGGRPAPRFPGDRPIGAAVVGLGFMGRTHVAAYQNAAAAGLPCELVAVCDSNPERLRGDAPASGNLDTGAAPARLFDPARVRGHANPAALFADPRVDLVSICTYTDTHVDLAIAALAAGKHVLVEKPVAIASRDVRRLAHAAGASGRLCMPGMCMRFWPGWDWLQDKIRSGSLGRVRSATFQRMGAGPPWSAAFYRDISRSGGALFDLHIHDADFIYWCFGRPRAVLCAGTIDHFTTLYRYDTAPARITAEGAWDLAPAAGFRMRYLVTFEHATAEFDLTRKPTVTLWRGDKPESVEVGGLSAYETEIRYFIDSIARSRQPADLRATLEDAVAVTELLEAEQRSLESGQEVAL